MKILTYQLLALMSLALGTSTLLAQESDVVLKKLSNPTQSIGIHIGDVLKRNIELEVRLPYQISKATFPVKGSNQNGIELVDFKVESVQRDKLTLYKLDFTYQVFASSSIPMVMKLPEEKFAVTGGSKALSVNVPAWNFWFSPLVVANFNSAKVNLQPQHNPPLVDIGHEQIRLTLFLGLLIIGLTGAIYVNGDKKWLPFMGGAFATAHRKLKQLPKVRSQNHYEQEKQALFYIHQAFNKIYGRNVFAQDIDLFLTVYPSFIKMKLEIESFFNSSNQSLFSTQQRGSSGQIKELIALSKGLRDCERGV